MLREVRGGPQIAVGGKAIASSSLEAARKPEMALDGDPVKHWHSTNAGAGNNWWGYDFGAGNARSVYEMVFTQRSAEDNSWSPNTWKVEWSDDGANWFPLITGTGSYPSGVAVTTVVRPVLPSERTMRVFEPGAIRARGLQWALGRPDQPVFDPSQERWRYRPALFMSGNAEYGGLFQLDGTTTSLGIPAPRRVRLYHQFSGRLIGEQITQEDGAFSFTHIEEGPWTVVGLDDTGAQNGVIFSHVKAVPMVL